MSSIKIDVTTSLIMTAQKLRKVSLVPGLAVAWLIAAAHLLDRPRPRYDERSAQFALGLCFAAPSQTKKMPPFLTDCYFLFFFFGRNQAQ